jgi:hypothetical protein
MEERMAEKDTHASGFEDGAAADAAADDSGSDDDDLSGNDADLGDGSDDGENDDEPDQLAELQTQLASTRADLAAVKAQSAEDRRQLGQVKAVQREVTKLRAELSAPNPAVTRLAESMDVLVSGLGDDVPQATRDRISVLAADGRTGEAVAAAEKAIRDSLELPAAGASDTPPADAPLEPDVASEWRIAGASVTGYAEARGLSVDELMVEIPASEWRAEMAKGPEAAIASLKAKVDAKVAAKNGTTRRAGKKAAAKAGESPPKSGGRAAKVTLAQLKGYTQEQVNAIPREERMNILAGKNG